MRYLLLILLFPALLNAQILPDDLPQGIEKRILLAHPTVGTINVINSLSTKGMLQLDNIELVGVYHVHENYDYSRSQALLDSLSYLKMYLVSINDTLVAENLYEINRCTPHFKELFSKSSGIFFFGGPDIPPGLYGESKHPRTNVTDSFRHYFEASFLFHLIGGSQNSAYLPLIKQQPDYFIHGFCLGMQTMNIASGGTLIQDIPSQIFNSDETKGLQHLSAEQLHRNFYPKLEDQCYNVQGSCFHTILIKNNKMALKMGSEKAARPLVNSYHHQAVEKLGKGFKVGAWSSDKRIIEAMYHKRYPNVFAVQFHPERSELYNPTRKVQFTPDGESRFLPEWIDEQSMTFHLDYWKNINQIIQTLP